MQIRLRTEDNLNSEKLEQVRLDATQSKCMPITCSTVVLQCCSTVVLQCCYSVIGDKPFL